MFVNELGDTYRIASSLNPHGYRPRGDKFSLKTIFKEPKEKRKLTFKAYDEEHGDRDVFLNGHKELTVFPTACSNKPLSIIVDSLHSSKAIIREVPKYENGKKKNAAPGKKYFF